MTDLALEQHANGHQVSVFSINHTQGFAPELTKAGVPVLTGGKTRPFDWGVMSLLRQAAKGVDIVHAHNFTPNYYAAAALLGLFRGPALVGTCHDMGTRLSNQKLRLIYRCSLMRTKRVAMVGQQVLERYVGSGMVPRDRASTVLNGIPVERFCPTPERRIEARNRLGLGERDLVIGCVGRLVGLKNHQLLLSVTPALVQEHPNLRVVIIGYGELESTLRQQAVKLGIQDHVLITGKRSDVAELLPAFDVFALPSQTEGLSIALLEACASGLAVVASRVGGNPEIIQHEETGLLVEANDAAALQQGLQRLLNDPPLRMRLGSAAARWVAANASTQALREAYDHFYHAALTASHPS
ncbi:MAG: glycosyltransferase [Burkholderiales bacterium]|nr:glycosyltransferase [Burkholderiales bacterium]